jgi:hypothetical protein
MKPLLVIFSILLFQPLDLVRASETYINTEDHPDGAITQEQFILDQHSSRQELRNLQKEENRYQKLENKFKKIYASKQSRHHPINGFSDPVDKWFWIWAIGWGVGILITIISGASIASGFLGILWFSLFIIGSIALIIWLIKKFGKS